MTTIKELKKLATTLDASRQTLSTVVHEGMLRSKLGSRLVAEAINRRWLELNGDGTMSISPRPIIIEQLSQAAKAEDDEPAKVGDEVVVADGGRTFSGKVAEIDARGEIRVTFEPGISPVKNRFQPTEVRITRRANDDKPASPAATANPVAASRPAVQTL